MLEGLQNVITNIGEDVKAVVAEKPLATAAVATGVVGAGALGVVAAVKSNKKRKTKTKKGRSRDRKFISKQKHEASRRRKKPAKIYKKKGKYYSRKPLRKAGKKKTKKRTGKIYYTKKGQPYKIMASGKARFVKKSSRRTK